MQKSKGMVKIQTPRRVFTKSLQILQRYFLKILLALLQLLLIDCMVGCAMLYYHHQASLIWNYQVRGRTSFPIPLF